MSILLEPITLGSISEATSISPQGVGYPNTPGIWSAEQIEGWKKVTTAVHDAGGKIMLQLWHVGRLSDPSFLNGERPVSASEIAAHGKEDFYFSFIHCLNSFHGIVTMIARRLYVKVAIESV